MTRKRFIKLAMSNGKQRNEAREIAKCVELVGSYDALYRATALSISMDTVMKFLFDPIIEILMNGTSDIEPIGLFSATKEDTECRC